MLLIIAVDNLDPEIFKKHVSEGKVKVLKKYLHVVKQYFEITACLLKKLGYKDELEGEYLVGKKRKRIKEILNENAQSQNGQSTNCDAESKQPQQSPVVEAPSPTVNTPEEGINKYNQIHK